MSISKVEEEGFFQLDTFFYSDQLNQVIRHIQPQFERAVRGYVYFHILFILLGIGEVVGFLAFFTFLAQSSWIAMSLSLMFLTLFSYFVLRLYFRTKKPDQLHMIKECYLNACQNLLNYEEEVPENYVTLANACCKFASSLQGKEYRFYRPPRWLAALKPHLEKFSCWWHWEDVHRMRELLLQGSVEQHIKLVKSEPTNLEVHAALANAYVMLSGLYVDPRTAEGQDDDRWLPMEAFQHASKEKFRTTAERAIEEFKILNDYAPHDPWVHVQLAYSYHDLQMPEEEIREYEEVFKICPNDKETLFKLGVLYFQQGHNAQGLQVYEELKQTHPKKAELLIKYYGAYDLNGVG